MRQIVCLLFLCALLTATGLVPESRAAQQATSPAAKSAVAAVVNLNTATAEQLAKLPGVGAKTAARIIDYRQKNAGFKKIEEQFILGAFFDPKALFSLQNSPDVSGNLRESQAWRRAVSKVSAREMIVRTNEVVAQNSKSTEN